MRDASGIQRQIITRHTMLLRELDLRRVLKDGIRLVLTCDRVCQGRSPRELLDRVREGLDHLHVHHELDMKPGRKRLALLIGLGQLEPGDAVMLGVLLAFEREDGKAGGREVFATGGFGLGGPEAHLGQSVSKSCVCVSGGDGKGQGEGFLNFTRERMSIEILK